MYLCRRFLSFPGLHIAMDWLKLIWKNKGSAILLSLALAWLLFHRPIAAWACAGASACWLYPDSWPALLGITSQSDAWLVALLAAVLFALPFGRSGLLATLVGIQLAEPVLGFWPLLAIYVVSSAVSIVLVHALVQQSLMHPRAAWIHLRLAPVQSVFSPAIQRNPILWLSVGNLVSSQWYMSALGVLTHVPRERVCAALMVGNLIGFALVYVLSQVPDLDAISVVLLTLVVALVVFSPVLWANLTEFSAGKKTAGKKPQMAPASVKRKVGKAKPTPRKAPGRSSRGPRRAPAP